MLFKQCTFDLCNLAAIAKLFCKPDRVIPKAICVVVLIIMISNYGFGRWCELYMPFFPHNKLQKPLNCYKTRKKRAHHRLKFLMSARTRKHKTKNLARHTNFHYLFFFCCCCCFEHSAGNKARLALIRFHLID